MFVLVVCSSLFLVSCMLSVVCWLLLFIVLFARRRCCCLFGVCCCLFVVGVVWCLSFSVRCWPLAVAGCCCIHYVAGRVSLVVRRVLFC